MTAEAWGFGCLIFAVLWLLAEARGILARGEAASERRDLLNRIGSFIPESLERLTAREWAERQEQRQELAAKAAEKDSRDRRQNYAEMAKTLEEAPLWDGEAETLREQVAAGDAEFM